MNRSNFAHLQSAAQRILLLFALLLSVAPAVQTAQAQCGGAMPLPGDFRSDGDGSWNAIGTWQFFSGTTWIPAAGAPGAGTTANTTICDNDAVQIPGNTTITLGGPLTVDVDGSITRTNVNSRLNFQGASLLNNGTIDAAVDFAGAGVQEEP